MDKAAPMAPNLDVWNTLAMPTHQGGQGEGCTHCRAAWGPGGVIWAHILVWPCMVLHNGALTGKHIATRT